MQDPGAGSRLLDQRPDGERLEKLRTRRATDWAKASLGTD